MMNPQAIMKLMSGVNTFKENHPKFVSFLTLLSQGGIPEGTVIEVTVTRPGEEPMTANMRVLQEDTALLKSLMDLK